MIPLYLNEAMQLTSSEGLVAVDSVVFGIYLRLASVSMVIGQPVRRPSQLCQAHGFGNLSYYLD